MRTGATQSTPIANPGVVVTIGADSYSCADGGLLVDIQSHEMLYGGEYTVELDNSDSTLTSKNYKGSAVYIYWGFIGQTGSTMHKLTVDDQCFISKNGKLLLQLHCIDDWGRLSFYSATLGGTLWNYPEQSAESLATRTLPSGDSLPADLITAISSQYDVTISQVVDRVLLDTMGILAIPESGFDDPWYTTKKPTINASDARSIISNALDFSNSYLRPYQNQFVVVNPSNGGLSYSYSVSNLFFSNVDFDALVRPNKIVYHGVDKFGGMLITEPPHGENAASINIIGLVTEHRFYNWEEIESISTQADANDASDAAMTKLETSLSRGTVVAPMHCSQELLDKVQIVDDRYSPARTTTGYVYEILREYSAGVYRITLTLGGVATFYTPQGGTAKGGSKFPPSVPPPIVDSGNPTIPKGEQSYLCDIEFVSVDYNHVTWANASVTFADGTVQNIPNGNLTLTGTHYMYVIIGTSQLQNSLVYSDAVGLDRVFVGVCSIGSAPGILAYTINPYTDSILINRDKVMDGLISDLQLASNAVTEAKIAANAVTGGKIAAYSIVGNHIQANAIDASKIQAGAITADKISAGAITAIKINVASLDSISTNCGTLTAGTINGVTIYGGNGTVKLDYTGINIAGAALFFFSSGGFSAYQGSLGGTGGGVSLYGMNSLLLMAASGNMTLSSSGRIYLSGATYVTGTCFKLPVGTNMYYG